MGIKKNTLAGEVRAEISAELLALLGRQPVPELDFEALEMAARRVVLAWAARLIEKCLNADTSDRREAVVPCRCGHAARYVDGRKKRVRSALGELQLERAYYHCGHCGGGFCPRDQQLGIQGGLSPAVVRMIAAVGAMVSFQEGSQLLEELAGVAVDAKQVQRTAEALGADIAADEKRDLAPGSDEVPPATLYLGVDGTGVPMRPAEVKGRSGKQPDGTAKTREVKLCTCWSAESRDAQDRPVRDLGSVSYTAAIESAATLDTNEVTSAFTQRVLREATSTYRRLDGCPVLFDPHLRRVKRIGADKEQALGSSESRLQGLGPLEISLPLLHPQSGKFLMLPRSTRGSDHCFRTEPPKLRNDGLSQVSTGARYQKPLVSKTHFLPPKRSSSFWQPSLMARRIRRRKAVPRDLPGAVIVFLEDKQLLVALRAFRFGRMVRRCPGGIRAGEGPAGTKLDDFGNCEFNVQGDRLKNRVVCFSDGRRTNCRLAIRGMNTPSSA